ncbi:MAG: hypothetical protein ACI4XM_03480 [Candidatus Coprovivens sp.]
MDKNDVYTNEQFYIVSLDNGIRKEEPITIDVINSFKDGSQLVQLNKSILGVYKSNGLNPELMNIDDYDIIKGDIAELFDVDHEETKRIVTEENNVGVFTLLNYSKNIETRISATTVLNHIIQYVNQRLINEEEASWITKVLQYPAVSKGNAITDKAQINDIINLGTYSLTKEIELQKGIPLSENSKEALIKKYARMILFDYIVGRKYRGLDYYLISKINEQGKPEWIDSYLSPISISNSIDKDQLVGDNEYMLNNKLINRDVLLEVLFEQHFTEIRKMTEAINDAIKLYKDAISRIIYNNTNLERAPIIESKIIKNLEKIAKLQTKIEETLDKEQKTNKVERTMATQSLNVRVTTKLDLIQKKYPINPKEHPELLNNKKITDEDIKLIVEEESKTTGGFAATTLLLGAVALICGIGLGIVVVILTLGN